MHSIYGLRIPVFPSMRHSPRRGTTPAFFFGEMGQSPNQNKQNDKTNQNKQTP